MQLIDLSICSISKNSSDRWNDSIDPSIHISLNEFKRSMTTSRFMSQKLKKLKPPRASQETSSLLTNKMAVMDSLTHRFSSSKWPMTKQRHKIATNTVIGITCSWPPPRFWANSLNAIFRSVQGFSLLHEASVICHYTHRERDKRSCRALSWRSC